MLPLTPLYHSIVGLIIFDSNYLGLDVPDSSIFSPVSGIGYGLDVQSSLTCDPRCERPKEFLVIEKDLYGWCLDISLFLSHN